MPGWKGALQTGTRTVFVTLFRAECTLCGTSHALVSGGAHVPSDFNSLLYLLSLRPVIAKKGCCCKGTFSLRKEAWHNFFCGRGPLKTESVLLGR